MKNGPLPTPGTKQISTNTSSRLSPSIIYSLGLDVRRQEVAFSRRGTLRGAVSLERSSLFFVLWLPVGPGSERVVFQHWLLQNPWGHWQMQGQVEDKSRRGFDPSGRQIMRGLIQVEGRKKRESYTGSGWILE